MENFTDNYSIYFERSNTLIRETNKLADGRGRAEIYAAISQTRENLLYVKNNLYNLSDEVIALSNKLVEEINIAINDFLTIPNKSENNTDHLVRKLSECAQRSEIIKTNIFFSLQSQSILGEKYRSELGKFIETSQNDASSIKSMKENLESELNALKETVEKFKETNKSDAENLELKTNAIDFDKIANDYNEQAKKWRTDIILIISALIVVSFWFMLCFNNIDIPTVNAQFTIENKNALFYFILFKNAALRVFILSILGYTLKFCVKNYNALRHNSTVNKHKSSCLEAAIRINTLYPQEDKVRQSILTLAGKEIFTHHRTGYLDKDENIDASLVEKLVSIGGKVEKG